MQARPAVGYRQWQYDSVETFRDPLHRLRICPREAEYALPGITDENQACTGCGQAKRQLQCYR